MSITVLSSIERFERALGNVDLKAQSLADTCDSVRTYVSRAYSNAILCVLYGSVARGDANGASDVDLLILSDSFAGEGMEGAKERVVIEGISVEAYVLKPSLAVAQLYAAPETGHYLVANALAEGIFIAGNAAVWAWLCGSAKATLNKKPMIDRSEECDVVRSRLAREIFKLRYKAGSELTYCAILILCTYQEFRLLQAGSPKGATSCMAKAFQKLAEQDCLAVYEAFRVSSISGDWRGMAEEILGQMRNFGGLAWETNSG